MSDTLRMTAAVRRWLHGLRDSDPPLAHLAGEAVIALLEHGIRLGPPLVAPMPGTLRDPDPRAALDQAYERQLEVLTSLRRAVADVATARKRLELTMDQPQAAPAEDRMAPLRAQYMDLTRTEEKLTADSQRLIGWIESFRSRKEALKAAYTAAEAQRAVNAAFAGLADEGEEAEVPYPDADADLSAAWSAASEYLGIAHDLERDLRPALAADGPRGRASRDVIPPGDQLLILRPGAPGCLGVRIMFASGPGRAPQGGAAGYEPAARQPGTQEAGADAPGTQEPGTREPDAHVPGAPEPAKRPTRVLLLAATASHAGLADGTDGPGAADGLVTEALASYQQAENSAAHGDEAATVSYDTASFLAEFFPGEQDRMRRGAAALLTRNQPQGLAGLRRRAGFTQAQVAQRLGVRQERVSAIERGDPGAAAVRTLAAYVEAVGGRLEVSADIGTGRTLLR